MQFSRGSDNLLVFNIRRHSKFKHSLSSSFVKFLDYAVKKGKFYKLQVTS